MKNWLCMLLTLFVKQLKKPTLESSSLVVTNSVAICKSASRIIKDKYPHVICSGCTTHGSDLVLDIGKIEWVNKLVKEVKANITFITNHHKSQTLFWEFSSKENNLELLRLGDTWFQTNFTMLKMLQRLKHQFSKWCRVGNGRIGLV